MPSYARRVDTNHQDIVDGLRAAHRFVADTSRLGAGFPDLVVSFQGRWYLLEIKRDKKAGLTPAQLAFIAAAKAPVTVVSTVEQAIGATSGKPYRQYSV